MNYLPPMALSIRQPWAWAIVHAGKDIENRSWPTGFRGPVCIHASRGMTRREYEEAAQVIADCTLGEHEAPMRQSLALGEIIGVAEVVGCVTESESPWFFGPYGFVLANVQPVPWVQVRGALGFFNWQGEPET